MATQLKRTYDRYATEQNGSTITNSHKNYTVKMNSVSQQMNKNKSHSYTPPRETAIRAVSENPTARPAMNSALRVY